MLHDLLSTQAEPDPLGRAADHLAGIAAISVGIGANASFESGRPVAIDDLFVAAAARPDAERLSLSRWRQSMVVIACVTAAAGVATLALRACSVRFQMK